jgi:hypothetical protein
LLRSAAAIASLASALGCNRSTISGEAGPSGPASDAAEPGVTSSSPGDAAPPPGTWQTPTLALLDPGRPPRRPLRYVWRPAQREQLTMDLRTTATTNEAGERAAGIPLPPVRIVLAIDPVSVSDDGDLRYRWRVTSTEVGGDAGTAASLVEGMRSEVDGVRALAGSAVVTSRGLTREVAIESGATADGAASGQMVDQVLQTLRDIAAPFPEEDVGVGARWQKLSEVSSSEARVTQTETFTLKELGPTQGALDNVLAQTAPPQPLHAPGMPPGAQARMESMLVSADAKTKFDRSRLVPQTRLESTTTMVLSGHSPGDSTRRVGMVLRVEILLAGALR